MTCVGPEPVTTGADLCAGFWGHLKAAGTTVARVPVFSLHHFSFFPQPLLSWSRLTQGDRMAVPWPLLNPRSSLSP